MSSLRIVDTHCHIQFDDYGLDPQATINDAAAVGVDRLLCVGCSLKDSQAAIEYAAKHNNIWATIGLHPHEAQHYVRDAAVLKTFAGLATKPKVVAVGECGLDYYYTHSPKEDQVELLRFQLDLAQKHDLPLIFHVREAFDDFWPIFDEYKGLRGVVHSFTATTKELDEVLKRDLYVGLNGIMTFTKMPEQLEMAKAVPLDNLLLETDAPFLTPKPFRGKIGEPKYARVTGQFLSELRGESLEQIATATSRNAEQLFGLK